MRIEPLALRVASPLRCDARLFRKGPVRARAEGTARYATVYIECVPRRPLLCASDVMEVGHVMQTSRRVAFASVAVAAVLGACGLDADHNDPRALVRLAPATVSN